MKLGSKPSPTSFPSPPSPVSFPTLSFILAYPYPSSLPSPLLFLASPLPSTPLRSRPLKRCKLPQCGLRRIPSQNRIWCILAINMTSCGSNIYDFHEDQLIKHLLKYSNTIMLTASIKQLSSCSSIVVVVVVVVVSLY